MCLNRVKGVLDVFEEIAFVLKIREIILNIAIITFMGVLMAFLVYLNSKKKELWEEIYARINKRDE